MARLAYLIMVAILMTSAFLGYEWVATSSISRIGTRSAEHARMARQATQTKLAAASRARQVAALSRGQTSVSENDPQPKAQRTAHVRPKHFQIASKPQRGVTTEASLGFGTAIEFSSMATLDRGH
jgi:hypothetical protein